MKRLLPLFCFFLFPLALLIGQTTTLSLYPVKDATVNSALSEQNFGSGNLRAQSWEQEETEFTERILIEFDLEAAGIPVNAYIIDAQLKLIGKNHQTEEAGNNDGIIDLLLEDWSEGEVNWENQPMATQELEVFLEAPSTSEENLVVDLTTWVRMQHAGGDVPENHGFLIRQEEEQIYAKRTYYSKEEESVSLRPVLEIEYRIPSPMSIAVTSSQLDEYLPNSGSIHLEMTSGDAPFQYQWSSNANQTENVPFADGLSAGTYTVTITDDNQITEVQSVGVGLDPAWKAELINRFDYFNGILKNVGTSTYWYGIVESGQIMQSPNGWFEYTIEPYTGRKMIGFGAANSPTFSDWRDIEYGIYLKNDNTFSLTSNGSQTALGSCLPGDIIRIKREGTDFKILKNGSVITTANRTLTELGGSASVKVVMYDPGTEMSNLRTSFGNYMQLRFDQTAEINGADGELKLSVFGGTEPYTYQWSTGASTSSLSSLNQGTYTVTITDANGDQKVKHTTVKSGTGWNWEKEVLYDNQGNVMGGNKVYFDNLENEVQSQFHALSDDNILAAQTVYDKYGRKVLTSLSAPVFENVFDYQADLLESSSGTEYDYSKFDQPITSSNTMGEVNNPYLVYNGSKGGVGWYYSNNNSAEPYQATTSYPYFRDEFSELNPGRIKRSAAPHDAMKMGSGQEVETYSMPVAGEMAYFFGYASGWEIGQNGTILDSGDPQYPILNFGIPEFPFQKKAIKTIQLDQNGVESIVIKDMDGKVIATCLSGPDEQGNNIKEMNVASKIKAIPGSYVDIHLPEGCENSLQAFEKSSGTKEYTIYDLKTEEIIYTGNGQSVSFPAGASGFYRIVSNSGGDITTIRYKLNYHTISLNYYDKQKRLTHAVAPHGFDHTFDIDGLSISSSSNASTFDYDVQLTDNWAFDFPHSPSDPHQISLPMTANPDPVNDLQYSNILVYLAEKGDPPALVSNNVSNGSVDAAPTGPGEPGEPEGSSPEPEDFYVASGGNGITSIAGLLPGDGGGNDFDDDPDPWFPCWQAPPNLAKYSYKFNIKVYNQYVKNGSLITEQIGTTIKTIYALRVYESFWGQGALKWNISTNEDYYESRDEIGLTKMDIQGALFYNIGNEISKTIDRIYIEVLDIEAYRVDATYHVEPGGCDYFTWVKIPIDDYQIIEDELELRGKEVTYNLAGSDFAPEHKIHEQYDYNALGQTIRKWSHDDGTTEYLHSREGLLRFSQNEEQRNATPKRFSYTNYDSRGRVIESGEAQEGNAANLRFQNYEGDIGMNGATPISATSILESLGSINLTDQEKIEPSYFVYDEPYPNLTTYSPLPHIGSHYTQKRTWGKLSYSYVKSGSSIENTSIFSYDPYGRVEWKIQDVNGLGVKTKDMVYTDRGEVERVIYQKHLAGEYFEHLYAYDLDGRLKKTYTRSTASANMKEEAEYFYYLHGPLKRIELAENLQGIDYIYNTLGHLKAINSPELGRTLSKTFHDPGKDGQNAFAADVFGMALDYFTGDYGRQGTYVNSGHSYNNTYNGNIKAVRWNTQGQVAGPEDHWLYSYLYNTKGWLVDAQFGEYSPACQNLGSWDQLCSVGEGPSIIFDGFDTYRVDNISYDEIGNIQSLRRRADNGTLMDDFTYTYKANHPSRLDYLSDAANRPLDGTGDPIYDDLGDQPSAKNNVYDDLGRLTEEVDHRKYLYNSYGLVKEVKEYDQNSSTYVPVVRYFYDENGQRLSKTSYDNGTAVAKKWYLGGVEYQENLLTATISDIEYDINGASRLGKFSRSNSLRRYEITDHLGNVRATVSKDAGGNLDLMSYSDYYPFGSEMPGRKFVSGNHYEHKYQGQFTEHDEEVNWEAFELRNWDGRLARWTTTDPYGQFWSPYLGMGNNPIDGIDPDGGLFGKLRAQIYTLFKGGEYGQYGGDGDWLVTNESGIVKNFGGSGFHGQHTPWLEPGSGTVFFDGKVIMDDMGISHVQNGYSLSWKASGVPSLTSPYGLAEASIDYNGQIATLYKNQPNKKIGIVPDFMPGPGKGFKLIRGVKAIGTAVNSAKVSTFTGLGNFIAKRLPSLNKGPGFRMGISKANNINGLKGTRKVFRATYGNRKNHYFNIDLGKWGN